jgi:hypothetical protein
MLSTVAGAQTFMPSRSSTLLVAAATSLLPLPNKVSTSAPCTPDTLGYCVANISGDLESVDCFSINQGLPSVLTIGTITFEILTPDGSIADFTQFFSDDGNGDCMSMMSWSPDDPKAFYGDSNLP